MSNHNLEITNDFTKKINVKIKTKVNGTKHDKDLEPGASDSFEVDDKPEVTITIKMDIKSNTKDVERGTGKVPPYLVVNGKE